MRWIFLSPVLLAISACGVQTEMPMSDASKAVANFFNSEGKYLLLNELPGVTAIARTEGDNTVVLEVENVPSGKQVVDPTLLSREFRKGFCSRERMSKLLERGLRVRMEMRSDLGVQLPTVYLATCAG